jgi:predicted nucleic acid-binding protein
VAVVVDANLLVALVADQEHAAAVAELLTGWADAGEQLHAPALLPYEAANALTRLIATERLAEEALGAAWEAIQAVPITYHALVDGAGAIRVALRLRRHSAWDAAYVALAVALGAQLWTLDGPLARNAADVGLPVQLVAAEISE